MQNQRQKKQTGNKIQNALISKNAANAVLVSCPERGIKMKRTGAERVGYQNGRVGSVALGGCGAKAIGGSRGI